MIDALVDKIFGVSGKYKQVLKAEGAEDVLYDLAKFCGALEIQVGKDAVEIARIHGRLEVYQHICKMLRMDEVDKMALIQKMQNFETQQKMNEGLVVG